MSTTAARRPTATPVRSALTYFGYVQLSLGLGALALVTVIFSAVVLIVHLAGTPTVSFVQYGFQLQLWMTFGLTIWTVWAGMDHLVPAGATRRAVWIATLGAGSTAGAVAGALSTVTVWLESLVYDRAGWAHVGDTGGGSADRGAWADGWLSFALDRGALTVAAALAGVLVGAAFYRFSREATLVAILTLPIAVAPVAVVGLVAVPGELPFGAFGAATGWWGGPVAVLVLLALAAVYAVGVAWLLLRDVPVRMRAL